MSGKEQIRQFQCDEIKCIEGEEGDLGQGSYGVVKLGFHKIFGAVAVKCIHHKGSNDKKKKLVKKFKEEMANCQKSQLKNVVQCFGYATWPNSIAIVMEYMAAGNLSELVQDEDFKIGYFLRLRFCQEIASGLAHLHNMMPKRIVHGDLKAENVLLTEDLHCKISDFGSSAVVPYTGGTTSSESVLKDLEYTLIYAAPERLSNQVPKKTPALDTYSFGIIIFVVLERQIPVSNKNDEKLFLQKIMNAERSCLSLRSKQSNCFNDQELAVVTFLEEIMQRCWSHDPCDRPSMADVHHHLLQRSANKDAYQVIKEVATALDGKNIGNKVHSDYQCSPLHKFHPPHFQLYHLECLETSPSPTLGITETFSNTWKSEEPMLRKSEVQQIRDDQKDAGGFLALNKRKVFYVDAKTFDIKLLPDLKYNHRFGSLSKLGNYVFAVGGLCQIHVEKIDLVNPRRWEDTCFTSMPRCVSAALNGCIYATGGKWWTDDLTSSGEKHDNQANVWLAMEKMKYKRTHHALVSLEDSLYAVGGKDLSSAERYDPVQDKWDEIASMASVRERHQLVAIDGSIYAIGGWDGSNKLGSVERYDPRTNKWSMLSTTVEPRILFGACAIDKSIYIAGGFENPIVEVFDPVHDRMIQTHRLYECEGVHYILAA